MKIKTFLTLLTFSITIIIMTSGFATNYNNITESVMSPNFITKVVLLGGSADGETFKLQNRLPLVIKTKGTRYIRLSTHQYSPKYIGALYIAK